MADIAPEERLIDLTSIAWFSNPLLKLCPAPRERGIVGGEHYQPLHDPDAAAPGYERLVALTFLCRYKAEALQHECHVMLPVGISGVGGGEAFSDGQRGLVARQRRRDVALSEEHVADLFLRDKEAALRAGIVRVRLWRGVLKIDIRGLVALERQRPKSPCPTSTSPIFSRETERSSLPIGISGVGGREALEDGQSSLVKR